jgi:hypothetical protein
MADALDGNVAGGALSELFTPEMTSARTTCAACGDDRAIGELRAYVDAPGVVLRCATCGVVQIRVVRDDDRAWVDFRGVRVWQVRFPTRP